MITPPDESMGVPVRYAGIGTFDLIIYEKDKALTIEFYKAHKAMGSCNADVNDLMWLTLNLLQYQKEYYEKRWHFAG